jgi:hypothetical protein
MVGVFLAAAAGGALAEARRQNASGELSRALDEVLTLPQSLAPPPLPPPPMPPPSLSPPPVSQAVPPPAPPPLPSTLPPP